MLFKVDLHLEEKTMFLASVHYNLLISEEKYNSKTWNMYAQLYKNWWNKEKDPMQEELNVYIEFKKQKQQPKNYTTGSCFGFLENYYYLRRLDFVANHIQLIPPK